VDICGAFAFGAAHFGERFVWDGKVSAGDDPAVRTARFKRTDHGLYPLVSESDCTVSPEMPLYDFMVITTFKIIDIEST
jgi:hypothetical protein